VVIRCTPIDVADGLAFQLPELPPVVFPKERVIEVTSASSRPDRSRRASTGLVGRYTRSFSYSGPTTIVHVEQNAQAGKNIYVDRDFAMSDLPAELVGADWVQAADGDSLYPATDLMEISVPAGTVVFVAHDDRLSRPAWLRYLFEPTRTQLRVNGRTKTVFRRNIESDQSLTLGPNVENADVNAADMYVVFVGPKPRGQTSETRSMTARTLGSL
jgi:beta-galactosidase